MSVVAGDVVRQRRLQMSTTLDQHPVQQLTTHRPDPSLGECVRTWRPHRHQQDPDAFGGEDGIEGVGELRVPVANQELELPDALVEVHEQVPSPLSRTVSTWKKSQPKSPWPPRTGTAARSGPRDGVRGRSRPV